MKAVLTAKIGSGYDDVLEERYHFPSTYLNQVKAAEGDLVVYYEPRRSPEASTRSAGTQSYFAMARIERIESDPKRSDHYFAFMTDFLDFDREVPFRLGPAYFEGALQKEDGSTNRGAFGRSVRTIPEHEFEAIVAYGFVDGFVGEKAIAQRESADGFEEEAGPFVRPLVEVTTTRPFRDRAFVRHIQAAYRQTCAFTGLQIINGGGRSEAQAAHIKPVAHSGSDSVRNGLALSSTIHWMFDRGLVSVDDDFRILTAGRAVPDPIRRLLNTDGMLRLPENDAQRPHRQFLRFHRENVFKG